MKSEILKKIDNHLQVQEMLYILVSLQLEFKVCSLPVGDERQLVFNKWTDKSMHGSQSYTNNLCLQFESRKIYYIQKYIIFQTPRHCGVCTKLNNNTNVNTTNVNNPHCKQL